MLVTTLLPEYDRETRATRLLLERVPEDKLRWTPHPKSMTLGRLAAHLGEIPAWVARILQERSFDLRGPFTPVECVSCAQALDWFDRHVAEARRVIAPRTDAELMAPWTLKKDGHEIFTAPKLGVLRNFLLNHMIHHRGQLSVYLRLNDVAIPSIYGPSPDTSDEY